MRSLAKLFFKKCCDGKSVSNDDKENYYAKASCPEGTPFVNIQLSPEGEVHSGGHIPRREASRYIYPPLFTDPEGDSCFSIYQIRWIKKMLLQYLFLNLSRNDAPFLSAFAKQ